MNSYYITGIAGSGKTTVCNELKNRGYIALDTDDFGLWKNIESGRKVERPNVIHDRKWYDQNKWELRLSRIKSKLAQHSYEDLVFLCGTSSDDREVQQLVDGVICLTISPDTLVHRLLARQNSDFGKSPIELEVITTWHQDLQEAYCQNGAIMINGEQPVEAVVEEILDTVSTSAKVEAVLLPT